MTPKASLPAIEQIPPALDVPCAWPRWPSSDITLDEFRNLLSAFDAAKDVCAARVDALRSAWPK
jgi:hypothetical protein